MPEPNWKNRTLWTGDNLDILRGLNSESVDLIYLDPPFNSNRLYSAPIGSEAAGAAFKDAWTLDDVDVAWHGEIADREPALYAAIEAAALTHSKSMKAYLCMMAVRLLELRRVLKPTGSIYLHCDPTASHYLKTLMDGLFGVSRFRNEIIWKRQSAHSDSKGFGKVADSLLFYGSPVNKDAARVPLNPDYVRNFYRHEDKLGVYRLGDLTASEPRAGESGKPWRGVDPGKASNHWRPPLTGDYAEWIEDNIIPDYRSIKGVHARLDALDKAGLIAWPPQGKMPALKRYLQANKGQVPSAIWTDIKPVSARGKERTGYPTQKPLALLERIIEASSNPGDIVLDPFCGCATALVAAEHLQRQWIGIDLSPLAAKLVVSRLRQTMGIFYDVDHRSDIPRRSDLGRLPDYRTHRHTLYGKQEGCCSGCGTHFPFRNLTVDHITPRAKGGSDHIDNLQLLCQACNSTKGTGTQAELKAKLKQAGIISVASGR